MNYTRNLISLWRNCPTSLTIYSGLLRLEIKQTKFNIWKYQHLCACKGYREEKRERVKKKRVGVMELQFEAKTVISLAVLGFIGLLLRLYNGLVVKPKRLRSMLSKQGIDGPAPTLLLGNIREIKKAQSTTVKTPTSEAPVSHNCGAVLFPFFDQWRKQYGIFHSSISSSSSSLSSSSSSSSYYVFLAESSLYYVKII